MKQTKIDIAVEVAMFIVLQITLWLFFLAWGA